MLVDSFSSVTVDFAVLFVMPVMGRMSDQDTSVRLAASMCFAQLIPLAALQVSRSHHAISLLGGGGGGGGGGMGDSPHYMWHVWHASLQCSIWCWTRGDSALVVVHHACVCV